YETPVMTDREKLRCNRYFWLFQLKNCWFSLLCVIVAAVTLLLAEPYAVQVHAVLLVLCCLLLLEAFFQRQIAGLEFLQNHSGFHAVTEEWLIYRLKIAQYALGGFLAAASVVLLFILSR
ncbi:MAG: hypothetical protein IKV57_04340, partial [Clostridia bacterium]|nr:hypothetical protein [Clostridia bacterium]